MTGLTNQGRPEAALIVPTDEDEEPECRSDKTEDGHEHHPTFRIGWIQESSRRHQDPHQTSKHLHGQTEQRNN